MKLTEGTLKSSMRTDFLILLLFLAVPRISLAMETIGWVEKVRIYPGNMLVKARIDSGAKTSSLSAGALTYFQRDNEAWVRFSTTNYKGSTIWLERKVVRIARIKQNDGTLKERPTITLDICLANLYQATEVTLENRDALNYQLLIGREFLNGYFLIKPNAVFTHPPRCAGVKMAPPPANAQPQAHSSSVP